MSKEKKAFHLKDPTVVTALENIVFHQMENRPAKIWLASLALLLVSKQDEEQAIEMNINGIRVEFNLLPPGEDYEPGKVDPDTVDEIEKEVEL